MYKILDVEAEIRHAPRDALVVADDHARHTGKRDAGNIQGRRLECT